MNVIGIASGKGGVGKTATSVNLAVSLALRGRKVMLFDADLGLANAQLALGCTTEFNFSHVLSGEKTLDESVAGGNRDRVDVGEECYVVTNRSGVGQSAVKDDDVEIGRAHV